MGALEQLGRYLWQFKMTRAGWYLAAAALFIGMLAISSLEIPVFYLFDGICGLFVMTLVWGWLFSSRVHVTGRPPDKATSGEWVTAKVRVKNPSRRAIFDLSAGYFPLPSVFVPSKEDVILGELGPGAGAAVPVVLRPLRRGVFELPALKVYTSFPFGVFRHEVGRLAAHRLLVLPRFHPLTSIDIPIGTRYQPGGIALTSNVGESPEYIGNREYRPGDPARRIDFRSWARLGRPVLREYQEEYYCRVALILDTFIAKRAMPTGGFRELEGAVSLAAAVADCLARGEHIIDLFAAGPELHVFRAGRHTAHFDNILEILAGVERCASNPFELIAPALADELGNISAVVCVLLDWDASRELLVRTAREAGCSVKVIVVRQGETTLPLDGHEAFVQISPDDVLRDGVDAL